MRGARGAAAVVWEWFRTAAVVLVVLLATRLFLVDAFKIPTASMEGTLLVGDFLLVNKALYGSEIPGTHLRLPALREPRLGEVIVFLAPHDPSKNYVKRLMAGPGDIIEMRHKRVFRNGEPVDEPYVRILDPHRDAILPGVEWQEDYLVRTPSATYRPTRDNWGPLRVPAGAYFVLGDNRDNSEDSRYWGFVPREALVGRPWRVYYSLDFGATPVNLPWWEGVRWDRIGTRVD
ncbi:MAG: signal peptidase I [Gemmatimonadota bacterium]